jgi:hypothetical protein
MSNNWEQRPFQLASGSLKNTETETKLPFNIGGVSRQGFEHIRCGISNQDAINFRIDDDFMIAVLCDGCTSHDESMITDYSSNEVGSRLLAEMIANFCYQDIKPRKNRIKIEPFLRRLNTEIHQRLKRLMKSLLVKGENQLPFLFNMMTSTVIVTVMRKKDYFVFHCGDGFVGINDIIHNLNSDSGAYLTNAFDSNFKPNTPLLKLIDSGDTSDLNQLYMASDGFEHSQILESPFFKNVLKKRDYPQTGYIDLLAELHLEIIEPYYESNQNLRRWPIDDASLIMLRKTLK